MRLALAAGIYEPVPTDLESSAPAAFERLDVEAADFLRAGGVVSLSEWAELGEVERTAFVRAGVSVSAERAAAAGLASQGVRGVAEVMRQADGGAAASGLTLESALSAVAERAARGPSIPAEGAS